MLEVKREVMNDLSKHLRKLQSFIYVFLFNLVIVIAGGIVSLASETKAWVTKCRKIFDTKVE